MYPLLSVLTPAYNAQDYIASSIESILNQSFKDFELIILDDASTDSTYYIAQQYQKQDSRIKLFKNKVNLNIAESRNILIKKSNGTYIAWQDADDISNKDRLKWQINYMQSHPNVGIVGGYLQFFNKKGNQNIRKYKSNDSLLRKRIFRYSPVAQPAAMIRKEVFDQIGYYGKDLSPAEDIDMSFRIGTKYRFGNYPDIVLQYRDNQKSATYKRLRKIELITFKTRIKFVFNKNYKFTLFDLLYNITQFASMFLIPTKMRVALFNKIRNS